jgi:hypothetical protein
MAKVRHAPKVARTLRSGSGRFQIREGKALGDARDVHCCPNCLLSYLKNLTYFESIYFPLMLDHKLNSIFPLCCRALKRELGLVKPASVAKSFTSVLACISERILLLTRALWAPCDKFNMRLTYNPQFPSLTPEWTRGHSQSTLVPLNI